MKLRFLWKLWRLPTFAVGDRVLVPRFGAGTVVQDQGHLMKGLYLIRLDQGWDIQYLADGLTRPSQPKGTVTIKER